LTIHDFYDIVNISKENNKIKNIRIIALGKTNSKKCYFKSSCSGKMTRFLRRNWTIRGGVVTSVYKMVLYCFIASKLKIII